MATINNLKEFFESRGFNMDAGMMHEYGRALYKGSCGVWISYMYEDSPAREIDYELSVKCDDDNNAVLASSSSYPDEAHLGVPYRVLSFFNMEPEQDSESMYHFDVYYNMLVNYDQESSGGIGDFEVSRSYEIDDDEIIISGKFSIPSNVSDVYYEDDVACACTELMADKVIGVKVGSIIEGADYDASPFELNFPFESEEFDLSMNDLESEVSDEWKKNNTTYFSLTNAETGEKVHWGNWEAFDDNPVGTWGDDAEMQKIAHVAGEMLLNNLSGPVTDYPGWIVKEEMMDFY